MTAKGFIVSKLFFYQKILFQPKIIESSQSKILFENNGPEVRNCYRMNQNHLLLISMVKSVSNHTYLTEPGLCRIVQIHFSFFVFSFVWSFLNIFPINSDKMQLCFLRFSRAHLISWDQSKYANTICSTFSKHLTGCQWTIGLTFKILTIVSLQQ